jgi:hypothetical protein
MAQNHIVRNKDYYLNTLNIEADLLKKASDIAERMMVAFMRESKVEVKVDVDDIADKIIGKILEKLPKGSYSGGYENTTVRSNDGFKYDDDEPVVIKTEKIEIKGKTGTVSKTKDSISESMDILDGLSI